MRTVKDVFEKLWGPLPEKCTCHTSAAYHGYEILASMTGAIISGPGTMLTRLDDEEELTIGYFENSPDISNRPAVVFEGYFGDKYDDEVRNDPRPF